MDCFLGAGRVVCISTGREADHTPHTSTQFKSLIC